MGEKRQTGQQRTISPEERRARLALRHRLAPSARAATAEEVAGALVALHATDAATVFLAAGARLAPGTQRGSAPGTSAAPDPTQNPGSAPTPDPVAEVERALYEDRTLTRMHGMRHTVFVVPTALAAAVHSSTTNAAAVRERASLVKHLAAGSDFDEAWLAETERQVLAVLAERGEATGTELGAAVPRLRSQYVYGVGTRQEGPQSVASRVLRVLGMEGRIARGRPQGGWTSSRFRWALVPPHPELPLAEAQSELVRHWLAAYGPGTVEDLKWWTGWKVTDVRRALAAVGAVEVTLDDGSDGGDGGDGGRTTGYVLPDDLDPVPVPDATTEPWAALLPALDPTAMGWRDRDWYLDPAHRPALFDRSGNIGPTVWWNGRIVGGWAQRPDGEIVWRLLDDGHGQGHGGGHGGGKSGGKGLGRDAVRAVEAEAARLAGWIGEVRVTPRFRTPLEKELSAG
ncbi:winged helix DNA-binding domain-containing protein [Streptomyces sp. NPDC126499]|uniref:winged helix DNA-binding domain-containing protein n=1 Tax=Streptomyces sp. NPDC126499 TaxID=3155314 RepID=UPI00331CFC7F